MSHSSHTQIIKRGHRNPELLEDPTSDVSSYSESEYSDEPVYSDDHHRDQRDVKRKQRHHQKGQKYKDHFHPASEFNIPEFDPMRTVVMPTGKSYFIRPLAVPKWHCSTKTNLVTLTPPRRMGRREFDIVAHEMGNTIVDLPFGTDAGGKYSGFYVVKIQKIVQGCAWRRYLNRQRDIALEDSPVNEKMLFHGSPNIGPIVAGGFDERHSYAGGKLGAGIYFTPNSSVANQFVFGFFGGQGCPKHKDKSCYICNRQMLLCRVTLGTVQEFTSSAMGQMSHPPPGHHSAVGLPGEGSFDYPEFVIYRGEQAYPEYLITYRIVK